jgi:hypothetical protein
MSTPANLLTVAASRGLASHLLKLTGVTRDYPCRSCRLTRHAPVAPAVPRRARRHGTSTHRVPRGAGRGDPRIGGTSASPLKARLGLPLVVKQVTLRASDAGPI